MTDPIQHDSPLFAWIRKNRLETLRRLVVWPMLGGVILYIFGEVLSRDWAIQAGIRLLLFGIAVGITYKFVSFVAGFREK